LTSLTLLKSNRRVNKVETLFPSYLFIKANQVGANFVRFGVSLTVIDELLISKLKKLINHEVALNKTG